MLRTLDNREHGLQAADGLDAIETTTSVIIHAGVR